MIVLFQRPPHASPSFVFVFVLFFLSTPFSAHHALAGHFLSSSKSFDGNAIHRKTTMGRKRKKKKEEIFILLHLSASLQGRACVDHHSLACVSTWLFYLVQSSSGRMRCGICHFVHKSLRCFWRKRFSVNHRAKCVRCGCFACATSVSEVLIQKNDHWISAAAGVFFHLFFCSPDFFSFAQQPQNDVAISHLVLVHRNKINAIFLAGLF